MTVLVLQVIQQPFHQSLSRWFNNLQRLVCLMLCHNSIESSLSLSLSYLSVGFTRVVNILLLYHFMRYLLV